MSDFINISLIFISYFMYYINCSGIVRSLKLKIVLIISNQEGPITECFSWECASFVNILFFFSKFFPVLLCPVVSLNTKVRYNEDLTGKLCLSSLF